MFRKKQISFDGLKLKSCEDIDVDDVQYKANQRKISFDELKIEPHDNIYIDDVQYKTTQKKISFDSLKLDKAAEKSFHIEEILGYEHKKKKGSKNRKGINKMNLKAIKKRKKKKRIKQIELNDSLMILHTDDDINAGALISKLMRHAESFIVKNKNLYIYNDEFGFFELCKEEDFSIKLNSLLDEDVMMKIKTSEYKEAYKQMLLSHDLITDEDFFENGPYVNCLNGVIDVRQKCLLAHSPKYKFKHCIQANYMPGEKCPIFEKYVNKITGGDKELILLLRVCLGYLFSHYNNGKIAILIISIPHTGKSVLCHLCENIIGIEYVSHVDLSMLSKQEYAASLSGKLLNIAPDLKNIPLKDVGFFKSLVSHNDSIATRALYSNPESLRGETKMLFSSNHLIEFDKNVEENDVQAVFNRLIYFPFQNGPISEDEDNKHLSEELSEEKDAIFTWAIEGLRKYIENNENFPKSILSEQKKNENIARYCPEKVFFDKCIKKEEGKYESVSDIKSAYQRFCSDYKLYNKTGITKYIEKSLGITKSRKRIDKAGNMISYGSAIYVYEGIRLINHIPEDDFDEDEC